MKSIVNLNKWFWPLEAIFVILVGVFVWMLWNYSQVKQELLDISLKLAAEKRDFYECSPEEFSQRLREEMKYLDEYKKSLIGKLLLVDSYQKKIAKIDSPGLYFMKQLKDIETKLRTRYPQKQLPVNLGFSSQMPADKDVPYLLYELDSLVRLLNTVCEERSAEIETISSVLPEGEKQDKAGYRLVVDLKADMGFFMKLMDSLNKEPIIFVKDLKIIGEKRPILRISIEICPISKDWLETTF